MFVRFRQTAYRLQVSLVETRRAEGKVKHEHVASLGSIKKSVRPTFRTPKEKRMMQLQGARRSKECAAMTRNNFVTALGFSVLGFISLTLQQRLPKHSTFSGIVTLTLG